MLYRIAREDPNKHLLRIELLIQGVEGDSLELQMPAWRPGRYQLADFAKNVMRVDAYDEEGRALAVEKRRKDRWKLHCPNSKDPKVQYLFYAHEMDAGSTYIDEEQLYVNPVSSFLYVPEKVEEEHRVELELPSDYSLAVPARKEGELTFVVPNMQGLMDTPLIASPNIKHHGFECDDVRFHLWFQGECKPDFQALERDMKPFIREQIAAFGEFPVSEYHFLYQILPYRTFHGVEHQNSTVIVLGPSYRIMDPKGGYEELMAVSSHELYHTWNVKRIRPASMMPYDFTRENYTRAGYIAEGVTTYMGDLNLLRSGFYSSDRFLDKLATLLQRHFDNPGRWNLSVADSSFDTWLDGYDKKVPGRKVSIYNEGALVAFMLDVQIREATGSHASLDDVMEKLYSDHCRTGEGFTEEGLIGVIEAVSGVSFRSFFRDHVNGRVEHTPLLEHCFEYLGVRWTSEPSRLFHEAWLGFRLKNEAGRAIIEAVHPASPAEKAGLEPDDEILALGRYRVTSDNLSAWASYFGDEGGLELSLFRDGRLIQREPAVAETPCYMRHSLEMDPSFEEPPLSFEAWKGTRRA